jgi:hypothetical protein
MIVNLVDTMALALTTCVLRLDYYELHLINKNISSNFLIGKLKLIIYVIKSYLYQNLHFVYWVEDFITLNLTTYF